MNNSNSNVLKLVHASTLSSNELNWVDSGLFDGSTCLYYNNETQAGKLVNYLQYEDHGFSFATGAFSGNYENFDDGGMMGGSIIWTAQLDANATGNFGGTQNNW